jgi:hypothetical protein
MHVVLARAKLQHYRLEPDARSAITVRQEPRQSQFRSKSRELPHVSRYTAVIMAPSVSGVPMLCGPPAFTIQCLMLTLLKSTRRTGIEMTQRELP